MTSRKIYQKKSDGKGKASALFTKEGGEPEIFVDGAWGVLYGNGVCKINLYSTAATDPEENIERREVAVRLVMSVITMRQLADFFATNVKKIEDRINELSEGKEEKKKKKPDEN